MKDYLLKFGQQLTPYQKQYIINTGKLPELTQVQRMLMEIRAAKHDRT